MPGFFYCIKISNASGEYPAIRQGRLLNGEAFVNILVMIVQNVRGSGSLPRAFFCDQKKQKPWGLRFASANKKRQRLTLALS